MERTALDNLQLIWTVLAVTGVFVCLCGMAINRSIKAIAVSASDLESNLRIYERVSAEARMSHFFRGVLMAVTLSVVFLLI
jgi:hypothetical protein